MQQGQFDDAETAFKKAAKLDPKLRDAQYNLAQIPFKKKEYAKARDRFETLYKRMPGGDKNQAAELIKFKIYMTLLMEGKESRAHSMMEEFGRMTFPNNRTASPLIDKDLVITRGITTAWGAYGPPGDRFYAFDKKTGELVWSSAPGHLPQDNTFSHPWLSFLNGKRVFYSACGDSSR